MLGVESALQWAVTRLRDVVPGNLPSITLKPYMLRKPTMNGKIETNLRSFLTSFILWT